MRSWFFAIPEDLPDGSIKQAINELRASNALNKIVESFKEIDVDQAKQKVEEAVKEAKTIVDNKKTEFVDIDVKQAKSVVRNQKTKVKESVEEAKEEIKEEVKEIRERYEDLRSKMVVAIALIVAIPSALLLFLDFDFRSIMSIQTLIRQVGRLEERVDRLYKPAGEGQPPIGPGVCSEEDFFFC